MTIVDPQIKDIPYPELVRILRAEFGARGPLTEEVRAEVQTRLKELQPHRELHILTLRNEAILGIAEGKL